MSRKKVDAFLGLGGNLDDPRAAMASALRALDASANVEVVAVSSLYRTPPWGKTDQPDFLNAVAHVQTSLSPRDLLERCLNVEHELKRIRAERWGPRAIDIDILWFDGETINEDGLEIPHPRMLDRAFVLVPLAEIAPDLELAGSPAKIRADHLDKTGITKLPEASDWWKRA